jgi:pyruvate dehydrogenase (quinone)
VTSGSLADVDERTSNVLDAVVNRSELAMPPSTIVEMAKGFTLYMVKAIMSSRGDEIVDLAKTNLWR